MKVTIISSSELPLLQGMLYFKSSSKKGCELVIIDKESFRVSEVVNLEGKDWGACVMFSDGESLGMITSAKDVSHSEWVTSTQVKFQWKSISSCTVVSSFPLLNQFYDLMKLCIFCIADVKNKHEYYM